MLVEKKMNIKNSALDYTRYKQLNCYGHVRKMNKERIPQNILEWCPAERKRKVRNLIRRCRK